MKQLWFTCKKCSYLPIFQISHFRLASNGNRFSALETRQPKNTRTNNQGVKINDIAGFIKIVQSEPTSNVAGDMYLIGETIKVCTVSGTPGTFVNGQLVKGAYPIATFTQIIDAALAN